MLFNKEEKYENLNLEGELEEEEILIEEEKVEVKPIYTPPKKDNALFKVGDKVKLIGKTYIEGTKIPRWIKTLEHTIAEINKDTVLLKEIKRTVYIKDIKK